MFLSTRYWATELQNTLSALLQSREAILVALAFAALERNRILAIMILAEVVRSDRKTLLGEATFHAAAAGHLIPSMIKFALAALNTNPLISAEHLPAEFDVALSRGADPNCRIFSCRFGQGLTPLYCATVAGSITAVRRLIACGAEVDACVHGQTALAVACQRNHHCMAHVLLEAGADPLQWTASSVCDCELFERVDRPSSLLRYAEEQNRKVITRDLIDHLKATHGWSEYNAEYTDCCISAAVV